MTRSNNSRCFGCVQRCSSRGSKGIRVYSYPNRACLFALWGNFGRVWPQFARSRSVCGDLGAASASFSILGHRRNSEPFGVSIGDRRHGVRPGGRFGILAEICVQGHVAMLDALLASYGLVERVLMVAGQPSSCRYRLWAAMRERRWHPYLCAGWGVLWGVSAGRTRSPDIAACFACGLRARRHSPRARGRLVQVLRPYPAELSCGGGSQHRSTAVDRWGHIGCGCVPPARQCARARRGSTAPTARASTRVSGCHRLENTHVVLPVASSGPCASDPHL